MRICSSTFLLSTSLRHVQICSPVDPSATDRERKKKKGTKSTNKVNWDEVPSPERLGFVICSSSWTWHSLLHTNWSPQSDWERLLYSLWHTSGTNLALLYITWEMALQELHTNYPNIVRPPMDPLHNSAETLIFINHTSILSTLVFGYDQMGLWLNLTQ